MTFKFETLPIENKEILRQGILELFDRDIAAASCTFNTRNYVFIFGEGCFPVIIRVSTEMPHRKVEDVLSELMWIDDLKNDVANVCQPLPSQGNRMVERIAVGEAIYLVTMFRKANGALFPDSQWDENHFYSTGALLGKIHRISNEGYQRGFRYKRKCWHESPYYDFSCYDEYLAPSAQNDAYTVLQRIKNIPRDPRWYGMIHGDYQCGNLFYDWGNLWLFDFDDSCYGYFMFDIACLAHTYINSSNYTAKHFSITPYNRVFGDGGILTQIRAGYSSQYQLPEEQWALFDDFYRLRIAEILSILFIHKPFPRDIMIALNEPMLAYFKNDKSPIDRLTEVQLCSKNRLTPEQIQIVLALSQGT